MRRFTEMNNVTKLAIATAAVAVVAVVGIKLPSPSSAAAPSASSVTPRAPAARHTVTEEGVRFSFRVPTNAGWERFSSISTDKSPGGPISLNKSIVGPQGAEAIIYWTSFPDGDYADPCASLLSPRAGRSVADLAAAVSTARGTQLVMGPADVTLGGRLAKRVILRVRKNVGCHPGFFYAWRAVTGGAFWTTNVGDTIRVWIVDVDGTRLFIAAETTPQACCGLRREVERIVESIRFQRAITQKGVMVRHAIFAKFNAQRVGLIQSAPAEPEVQTPVWSPDGRKVVFSSRRDGNWEIYVVNADGSGQRNLTRNPALDGFPAWSPDGRKIAFVRHHENGERVHVMNADGSGQRMLARKGHLPAWSPDGRKIAFSGEAQGIFVMNADGSRPQKLMRRPTAGRKASLAWSPDGRKLSFLWDWANHDFGFDLYVMNADGSGRRRLPQRLLGSGREVGLASDPAWSPDGRKIAVVSHDDVFVMNADGSGTRRLTRNPASDSAPAWSPDGRKIAFVSDRDGTYEVYVMNADGSGQLALGARTVGGRGRSVGAVAAPDDAPAWSPDGRKIAFVSDRDGTFEVYVMNADGSGQQRLTQHGS